MAVRKGRAREASRPNPPKESSGDYGQNAMGTLGRPAGASKKDEVRCRPAGGECGRGIAGGFDKGDAGVVGGEKRKEWRKE
jgi:hypothetical protein